MSLRRVLQGFALLASATLISQVIGFVALAIVARRVGPENLGAFQFAYTLVQYVALPLGTGVALVAVRDVARDPARIREIAGDVLALQLTINMVAFGALLAAGPLLAPTDAVEELLPILALTLIASAASFEWALQAAQKMSLVGTARVGGQVVFGALVPLLVTSGFTGTRAYAWLFVLGYVVRAAITIVLLPRIGAVPRLRFAPRRIWRRFVGSLTVGFAFVMIQIYYHVDSLMLGYLDGAAAVGQYAVAYKVPLAILSLGSIWVTAIYPHAAELAKSDPARLRRDVGTLAGLSLVAALPLAAGAAVVGEDLMPLLFGDEYGPAGTPFILLMVAMAVILFSLNFSNPLIASGDDKRFAIGVAAGAVVNVALNLVFIPAFGTVGAAVDTIVAELVVLAYLLHRFGTQFGLPRLDVGRIARIAAATAIMVAALWLARDAPTIPLLAGGSALYLAAAFALRAVTPAEVMKLMPGRERSAATTTSES